MSGTRPRRYHPMIFWSSAGVMVLQSRPIICGRPPNCHAGGPNLFQMTDGGRLICALRLGLRGPAAR